MNADRRLLTPIAGSLVAGVMIAAATLGGSFADDRAAPKGDRFAVVGDSLCGGQAWPNISAECLAWSEAQGGDSPVRFVTIASHIPSEGTTTLVRMPADEVATQ